MIDTMFNVACITFSARIGWILPGALIIALPQLGRDFMAGYRRARK